MPRSIRSIRFLHEFRPRPKDADPWHLSRRLRLGRERRCEGHEGEDGHDAEDAELHGSLLSHAGSREGNLLRVATVLGSRVVAREDSLTELLDTLLTELEQFGKANDGATTERPRRMLNITRDTGEFLVVLIRAMLARRVLEIGTSNGYSTLWLASAARAIGGAVTTVELSDYKIGLAKATFGRSGLVACISLVQDDAGRVLQRAAASAFDLIFLDSERPQYPGWWPDLKRALRPGGCWWSTTPPRIQPRWRRSSRWSLPMSSSSRVSFPWAMESFSLSKPIRDGA